MNRSRTNLQRPRSSHHRNVNSTVSGHNDSGPQPIKIFLVELAKTELRLTIQCQARPGAEVGQRIMSEVLPSREPNKIVVMTLENFQIGEIVKIWAPARDVLEISMSM